MLPSSVACSDVSRANDEPLAGTATRAARWLVVEQRGRWGSDAVADTPLPGPVRAVLEGFDGRVLLARIPRRERGDGTTAFVAESDEEGGTLRRMRLDRIDELAGLDLAGGEPIAGPLVLVCGHGARDRCCAVLGAPVYAALRAQLPDGAVWQSSHHGGHRFAANVLVLPAGVQLGRVQPGEAEAVAAALATGRIPLDRYRGRTLYAPEVQAAEVSIRRARGLDRIADLRLLANEDGTVRFTVPGGEVAATVEEVEGPPQPASCGAEPEPTTRFVVTLEQG